jgi:hypothetical protein
VSFCTLVGFRRNLCTYLGMNVGRDQKRSNSGKSLTKIAGTTRLELATSAVTVSGIRVLLTTWKSTDGTVNHWKYIRHHYCVSRCVWRIKRLYRILESVIKNRKHFRSAIDDYLANLSVGFEEARRFLYLFKRERACDDGASAAPKRARW